MSLLMKKDKKNTAMWSLETQVTHGGGQALKVHYKLPFQQAGPCSSQWTRFGESKQGEPSQRWNLKVTEKFRNWAVMTAGKPVNHQIVLDTGGFCNA